MNLRQFVEHQALLSGQRVRMDCPKCGGNNTFSITKEIGETKYGCFRASCGAKGIINSSLTADDLSRLVSPFPEGDKPFVLPDTLVSVDRSIKAVDYLSYTGIEKAYKKGLCDIRYDIRTDRVVFVIYGKDREVPIDAAGRALQKGTKPKWLRYGDTKYPYVIGKGTVNNYAVLVEDAPSAARLAESGTLCGIALLGTNISPETRLVASGYTRVYIGLDFDASDKGFQAVESMNWFNDVRFLKLTKDIKDLEHKEFDALIKRIENEA